MSVADFSCDSPTNSARGRSPSVSTFEVPNAMVSAGESFATTDSAREWSMTSETNVCGRRSPIRARLMVLAMMASS